MAGMGEKKHAHMNLARLRKGNNVFEVVIDSEAALEYRKGGDVQLRDVLKAERIFSDAQKGMEASEKSLEEAFGTSEFEKIADAIIKEGEIQLTAEQRKRFKEEKLRQIINIIHTNGVDPRTHAPHPPARIERAIEEAGVSIDAFKPAREQVKEVVRRLQPILPIRFEVKEILLSIPASYAPKCYSAVKSRCTILSEEWQSDGSWSVRVEIPAGIEDELYDKLNSITHGNIESKLLSTK